MWFPLHTRRTHAAAVSATILSCCFLLCTGCTQLPKLHSSMPHHDGDLFAIADDESAMGMFAEDVEIPIPVFDDEVIAAKPKKKRSRKRDSEKPAPRVASIGDDHVAVSEPEPFKWQAKAESAGGRDIETVTVGNGGYRTLIVGSLAGDDPVAIRLTELLAEHIHKNSIVLGGIKATVIRNANPDGAALFQMENHNGVYLNRAFPSSDIADGLLQREPEVRFLLGLLQDHPPQRVIHIRTRSRRKPDAGAVAASSGASQVAKDVCNWLNLEHLNLPQNSADGTLERLLSTKETCEVITFAIPQNSPRADLWETYGDSLLNLLLDEDYETRKLARQQKAREYADRRTRNDEE